MNTKKRSGRREFLSKLSAGTAALTFPVFISGAKDGKKIYLESRPDGARNYSANDTIRLATIGFGIQGIGDTAVALEIPGVELAGVCDLYNGRLERAKEIYGNGILTTRDYREIVSRKDIDAVIVATPDHWHERIAIDAMKAGKAVYLEKPMIKKMEEGARIIQAEKDTNAVLQIGSQGMSSINEEKAKQLYKEGAIGELILVEIFNDRFSSEGAWQYPIPPDANPDTIDFDRFLGSAPKVAFDPMRFFRWRNYQDYGTGVAGDLFVHSFSSLHFIIDSHGPVRAMSTGGTRYWKDGRDVPDILMALYDFPATNHHPAFNAVLRINFTAGNGGGGGFRLIGSEGELDVGWNSLTLRKNKMSMKPSGYSLRAYTDVIQKEIIGDYNKKYDQARPDMDQKGDTVFESPRDYKGADYDHFYHFFEAMRGNKKIIENGTYGMRAAGAALLANFSFFENKIVNWDPENMKLV